MRKWIDIILEYSIPNTLDRTAVVAGVYNAIDWSGGSGEGCLHDYAREMQIDYDNDEIDFGDLDAHLAVDRNSPEFKDWFAGWVERNYGDAEWDILDKVDNHHITLWRCITAPEDWTPEGRHPGICWSYIEDAAEAHWGHGVNGHVEWMMQASVPVEGINWLDTLIMAGQPDYEDEKEVRLIDDYPVTVEKYWRKK
jgi:hypothetical protein